MDFKRHHTKTVRLNTGLKAPGNLRALMESEFVKELAESIDKYGMVNPPTINKVTKEIIAGRNRVAAHFVLKRDMIEVCYVELEDLHAKALEIVENLHRRHDPEMQAQLQYDLMRIYEEEEKARDTAGDTARDDKNTRGPKASPRRRAVKRAAEVTGKKTATIQRAVQRAEKKERDAKTVKASVADNPTVITFGLDIDADFLLRIAEIQAVCDAAYSGLVDAQRRLTKLRNNESPIQQSAHAALLRIYSPAASTTKAWRPVAICPGCKLMETILPECSFCFGSGYVGEGQWKNVPRELKSDKHLVVQVGAGTGNATFVSYDSMFDYDDEESVTEDDDTESDLSGLFTLD